MLLGQLRSWLANADNQGNTATAAGALLVLDGLFGLENPLDGREKRSGIFGSALGVVIGIVVLAVGFFWVLPMSNVDSSWTKTQGTVVDVKSSTDSEGTQYQPVVEFQDESGGKWQLTGTISSSSRPAMGKTYEVAYPASDPMGGTVIQKEAKWIAWAVMGFGGIFLLASAFSFTIRSLSIAGGIYLIYWGRKRANSAPGAPLFPKDSMGGRLATWAQKRFQSKNGRSLFDAAKSKVEDAPAPSRSGPPPGWYEQGNAIRWWDGHAWTEHTKPRASQ